MISEEHEFRALFVRLRHGDALAARELVDKYGSYLLRVVRRRLHHHRPVGAAVKRPLSCGGGLPSRQRREGALCCAAMATRVSSNQGPGLQVTITANTGG